MTIYKDYISDLEKKFEKITGAEKIEFNYKEPNKDEEKLTITQIKWNSRKSNENLANLMLVIMKHTSESYSTYRDSKNSLERSSIIDYICNKVIYSIILKNRIGLETNYMQMKELKSFIHNLIELASQTYEQRLCTISFILIKKSQDPSLFLHNHKIDFLPFNENEHLEFSDITKYSKALRLIDSLSLSYVIDESYKIIGIAKKRKSHQSIREICSNFSDDNCQFIYLENKKIHWHLDKDRVLLSENFQWKLKDYNIIKNILKDFLDIDAMNTIENSKIDIFSNIIKDLSNNNTGALFSILGNNYRKEKENVKYRDSSVLNNIFSQNELNKSQLYKKIIHPKNDFISINQNTDPYLIKLIADVDGAVILNKSLKILDFGKMIAKQEIIDSSVSKKEKVIFNTAFLNLPENKFGAEENLDTIDSIGGGARSTAAFYASTFGLAIKISEDGGISIFQRRKQIFKL